MRPRHLQIVLIHQDGDAGVQLVVHDLEPSEEEVLPVDEGYPRLQQGVHDSA